MSRIARWLLLFLVALSICTSLPAYAAPPQQDRDANQRYHVTRLQTPADRRSLARLGVQVDGSGPGFVDITADSATVAWLRKLGYRVDLIPQTRIAVDSAYHTYASMVAEVEAVAAAHPDIVSPPFSIGNSYENRPIIAVKISDNPTIDEQEPEALFVGHYHAREHLTVEMMLDLLHMFVDGYGTPDHREIDAMVQQREIWLIFDMNPDGGEYDTTGGTYHYWRKNRQPNLCGYDDFYGNGIGTDLNRNHSYKWGYSDNGSSGDACSETYRGASAASTPEITSLERFVNSRVISGTQQINVAISFHTYGQLVLWPYGYTSQTMPPDMQADDAATFVALGQSMAHENGYVAEQASALYPTNGDFADWAYGSHHIFGFTFEMSGDYNGIDYGFYPPGSVIAAETTRNRKAVLVLLAAAACPYAAGGRASRCTGARFEPVQQSWLPLIAQGKK